MDYAGEFLPSFVLVLPCLAADGVCVDAGAVGKEDVDSALDRSGRSVGGCPHDVGLGTGCGTLPFSVDPDVAASFEGKCIPDNGGLAFCLVTLDALAVLMLGGVDVVDEAVVGNDSGGVAPTETVECGFVLELDVAEDGVDCGYGPSDGVCLDNDLHFGVLGIVDCLDVFEEVLSTECDYALGNVVAGEDHFCEGDELLEGPFTNLVEVSLDLVAYAFGGVDALDSEWGLDLDLALTTCP